MTGEPDNRSLAVVMGRFQPLHNGHASLFKHAFDVADDVLALIGSSDKIDERNPLTFGERRTILLNEYPTLQTRGIRDYNDDHVWAAQVAAIIDQQLPGWYIEKRKLKLVYARKQADHNGRYHYMDLVEQAIRANIRHVDIQICLVDVFQEISATDIRNNIDNHWNDIPMRTRQLISSCYRNRFVDK